MRLVLLLGTLALTTLTTLVPAATIAVDHPFILWTADEAEALKARIDTDPQAAAQYERMCNGPAGKGNGDLLALFKYSVMGDTEAGERQLKKLRAFIGRKPEPMTWDVDLKTLKWNTGNSSHGDRHMRDEQTIHVLRYDILYDRLTDEERAGIQTAFKTYIEFQLSGHPPRHPAFRYTRTGWLPNMHWPRCIGTHIMAVALRDEEQIKAMFNGDGGFKWYLDKYLADGRFYMEEFGKYYSNIGSMIMYCEGLRRLGLDQYGWGYTGTGGATMQRHLFMLIELGYPRTDMPGGMPNYRRLTMGDAKGKERNLTGVFEHSIIQGHLPNGRGGNRWWSNAHMNGPMPKMQAPFWLEAAHARFPDAGFDYFLAALRAPGEDTYLPTLYFGLGPIDPTTAEANAPAMPSYFAHERGFAFLRMEETGTYWSSPRPAVTQQFGMYYVHYVHDCFSLLGYHAFNRPIYTNAWGGGRKGYAGGNQWKDSVRGHCGVIVDNQKIRPIDRGEQGLARHSNLRFERWPIARLSGARAKGLYRGVDSERVIVLTDHYLFDVYRNLSDKPHRYEWQVMGPGIQRDRDGWEPTTDLYGHMLYRPVGQAQPEGSTAPLDNDPYDVHRRDVGTDTWSAVFQQDRFEAAPKSELDPAWHERQVGVKVSLLGGDPTTAFAAMPPVKPNKQGKFVYGETGGFLLIARRDNVANATFAALHEPFEQGQVPDTRFSRIAETDTGIAVRVTGQTDDRVLIAYGDAYQSPVTLAGEGESFTFSKHAIVRREADTVHVHGALTALAIAVTGTPKLLVNGVAVNASHQDGVLRWSTE